MTILLHKTNLIKVSTKDIESKTQKNMPTLFTDDPWWWLEAAAFTDYGVIPTYYRNVVSFM